MRQSSERSVAVHESAHAVLGLIFRQPVAVVALHEDAPDRGVCVFSAGDVDLDGTWRALAIRAVVPPAPVRTGLLEWLQVLLAGPLAEARARGKKCLPGEAGAWYDVFEAEQLLAGAMHQPAWSTWVHAALEMIEGAARRQVDTHWPWIEAVAAALVVQRSLSGDQVRDLRPPCRRRAA